MDVPVDDGNSAHDARILVPDTKSLEQSSAFIQNGKVDQLTTQPEQLRPRCCTGKTPSLYQAWHGVPTVDAHTWSKQHLLDGDCDSYRRTNDGKSVVDVSFNNLLCKFHNASR